MVVIDIFNFEDIEESFHDFSCYTDKKLIPCEEESVNYNKTNNLYIEGDNLEVLKLLNQNYSEKIKLIYIDPPYNTGNKFIYNDKFSRDYKIKNNKIICSKFNHINWINMMLPRLRLAYNLLKKDGVIFISIDDHEVHNLRKICDEVFGEENFVANIIWENNFSPKNNNKHFSENHDYIIVYAKSKDNLIRNLLPFNKEQLSRYKNPDNDPRGDWSASSFSEMKYTPKNDYEIVTPSGRKVYPPLGKSWRFSKERFKELLKDNRVWFGTHGDITPRYKRFLSEVQNGKVPMTIWNYQDVGHTQESKQELIKIMGCYSFDTPKPVRLLKRIIYLYTRTNANDIILDFFSGSSAMAHAVMELNVDDGGNRKFIMVQIPEPCDEKSHAYKAGYKNICEIGKERIRRAGNMIIEKNNQISLFKNNELDFGFKVLKLK